MICRQGSSASSDTYGSCLTHMQSSPSNYDITPDALQSNVYLNPLDISEASSPIGPSSVVSPPPRYCDVMTDDVTSPPLPNSSSASVGTPGTCKGGAGGGGGGSKGMNQVGHRPSGDHQLHHHHSSSAATAAKQPSPKHSEKTRHKGATSLRQMFKNRKQKSLTLAKPRARFSADSDSARSHSSTDSVNSQGSVKTASSRFRKAPFGSSRHHSSPSTGKKLANYHLIANSQSGESKFQLLLLSTLCYQPVIIKLSTCHYYVINLSLLCYQQYIDLYNELAMLFMICYQITVIIMYYF